MAATRLTEAQKQEMVARLQAGENTTELAQAYGCSPNTVIRVGRAALGTERYEELKQQRQRRGGRSRAEDPSEQPAEPAAPRVEADADHAAEAGAELAVATSDSAPAASPEPISPAQQNTNGDTPAVVQPSPSSEQAEPAPAEARVSPGESANLDRQPSRSRHPGAGDEPAVLAIDDADDFGDDDTDDDESEGDDSEGDDLGDEASATATPGLGLSDSSEPQAIQELRPFRDAPLSAEAGVYMLVDKTVELQARALAELPELGRLPEGENERQALVIYANPRQAKRHCGRNQRVIKVPDPMVFERTAPYLLAQGISRMVVDGAVYTLPGS